MERRKLIISFMITLLFVQIVLGEIAALMKHASVSQQLVYAGVNALRCIRAAIHGCILSLVGASIGGIICLVGSVLVGHIVDFSKTLFRSRRRLTEKSRWYSIFASSRTLTEFQFNDLIERETDEFGVVACSKQHHIRLLTLFAGSTGEPLAGDLITTPLDSAPAFEALSYCWGNHKSTTFIAVSGFKFTITTDLHTALLYLRHGDKPRCLWIDAICINQTDNREKTEQTTRMRDIYQRARQVLVWLGPEESGATEFFELCKLTVCAVYSALSAEFPPVVRRSMSCEACMLETRKIIILTFFMEVQLGFPAFGPSTDPWSWTKLVGPSSTDFKAIATEHRSILDLITDAVYGSLPEAICPANPTLGTDHHSCRQLRQDYLTDEAYYTQLSSPYPGLCQVIEENGRSNATSGTGGQRMSRHQFNFMIDLLRRKWFTRSWTIQELVLAERATVCCGNAFIDWDTLVLAILPLWREFTQQDISSESVPEKPDGIFVMAELRQRYQMARRGLAQAAKIDLLWLLHTFRLRSATDPRDKVYALLAMESRNEEYLSPEYSRSTSETYMMVASALIVGPRPLDLLSIPRNSRGGTHRNMPSWVPDWSDSSPNLPSPLLFAYSKNNSGFGASGQSLSAPCKMVNDSLAVRGYSVDVVRSLSSTMPRFDAGKVIEDYIWSERDKAWFPSWSSYHRATSAICRSIRVRYWIRRQEYFIMKRGPASHYPTGDKLRTVYVRMIVGPLCDFIQQGNKQILDTVSQGFNVVKQVLDEARQKIDSARCEVDTQTLDALRRDFIKEMLVSVTQMLYAAMQYIEAGTSGLGAITWTFDIYGSTVQVLDSYEQLLIKFGKWLNEDEQEPPDTVILDTMTQVHDLKKQVLDAERITTGKSCHTSTDSRRPVGTCKGLFHWLIRRDTLPHLRGRRLAWTENGYLAAVPRHTKAGDQVCLLQSGQVPILLREMKHPGTWTLVGDAYVYGMMHGEKWDERRCHEMQIR